LDAHRSSGSGKSEAVDLAHEPNFILGSVEVRPSTRELACAGRSLIIEPLAMQVLVVLGRNPGVVISRDDLIDQCWGGRIVTEDSVTRVLSILRRIADNFCERGFSLQSIRSVGCRLVVGHEATPVQTTKGEIKRHFDRHDENQRIAFCRTRDGVKLAYGRLGEGPPLVKTPNWHGHLEHEIESPLWRHWINELSSRHTLVRYDQRGSGMSDWNVPNLNFDQLVQDFVTVVDAAGVERFDLLAISQGAPLAIAFAARYPERVGKLVLINSFPVRLAALSRCRPHRELGSDVHADPHRMGQEQSRSSASIH